MYRKPLPQANAFHCFAPGRRPCKLSITHLFEVKISKLSVEPINDSLFD